MSLTSAQLTALAAELTNDPQNYGYAPFRLNGADQTLADMLNFVRDGATAPPAGNIGPAITGIREDFLMVADLLEAIDNRDLNTSASVLEGSLLESLLQQRTLRLLDASGQPTRVLGNLRRLFQNPGPQGTRSRIDSLALRSGSRAEQLFGPRVVISNQDVAAAFGRV